MWNIRQSEYGQILFHILPHRQNISYSGGLFHIAQQYFIKYAIIIAEVKVMKENKLVDLSMDSAIKIIKLCETIKHLMKRLAN